MSSGIHTSHYIMKYNISHPNRNYYITYFNFTKGTFTYQVHLWYLPDGMIIWIFFVNNLTILFCYYITQFDILLFIHEWGSKI